VADSNREERARGRAAWAGARSHLATFDDAADVMTTGTPSERVAMVWGLTLDAWAMSGRPLPDYPRDASPGRIVRRHRS
jgi:hypothetical protein